MAKSKKQKRRFYRAKLPMIVWDPRHNRALCSFEKGHVITDDDYTIERLEEIGYPEVALDATHPPEIVEPIQPAKQPDAKPVPAGLSEKAVAKLQQGSQPPATPAAGTIVPKNTPGKGPKNSPGKKRTIKRRDKS